MLFRLLVLTLAKDLHLMERNILSILLFPSSETVRKITNCFIQKKKNVLKKSIFKLCILQKAIIIICLFVQEGRYFKTKVSELINLELCKMLIAFKTKKE
jgi:hypothetical protein